MFQLPDPWAVASKLPLVTRLAAAGKNGAAISMAMINFFMVGSAFLMCVDLLDAVSGQGPWPATCS
ncbi:MAG: hypothetical protein V9G29_07030 [Burkholderiaceae bacterium]